MRLTTGRRLQIGLLAAAMACAGGASYAQRGFREGVGFAPPQLRPPGVRDRRFAFCKLMYESVRFEQMGIGWSTDYPYAGINLMIRLSELTKTDVSFDKHGEPNHWVVRLTDPALFDCPFLMASDVGTLGFTAEEIPPLREYLLKGGFLWVDDFWGTPAWRQWEEQIGRALPPGEYPIVDLAKTHPIYRTLFELSDVPQVTNIQFWRRSGGRETSERGADSVAVDFRGIADRQGRVMVLMTHNSDIGDSWEREGEDPEYFYQFSPNGYGLGMNVLLYSLTH